MLLTNKLLKFRKLFSQLTKLRVYKRLPFGLDPFYDLKHTFKTYPFTVIFDVGANVGQSVDQIRMNFPNAQVRCFEPVQRTFEVLKKNTSNQSVCCHQLALGAENTTLQITVDSDNTGSDMNSLVHAKSNAHTAVVHETIQVKTLDSFCASNAIHHIDYLKVDTEGYDLEVLKGAVGFLEKQAVGFIEVEVGMNPENTYHVDFVLIKQFMENLGYRMYGIYDQMHEWPTKSPVLRRVNALFISKKMSVEKQKA